MIMNLEIGNHEGIEWCGPSAISLIAGIPLHVAQSRMAHLQNKSYNQVSVSYVSEMKLILSDLGFNAKPIDLFTRYGNKYEMGPTIQRFVREMQPIEKISKVLIETHGHVLVSHMGFVGDNWTKKMVPLDQFPKVKRHVIGAHIIIPK